MVFFCQASACLDASHQMRLEVKEPWLSGGCSPVHHRDKSPGWLLACGHVQDSAVPAHVVGARVNCVVDALHLGSFGGWT